MPRLARDGSVWAPIALALALAITHFLAGAPRQAAIASAPEGVGACPSSIEFGQAVQCYLPAQDQAQGYTFVAQAGDKVLARMGASGDVYGFSPMIQIYAPGGGKSWCQAGQQGYLVAEIASCSLPSDGTYTLVAFRSEATSADTYGLYLQRLNNPGHAAPIGFAQTLDGSIQPSVQMDAYTFTAAAGDRAHLKMTRDGAAAGFYPAIRLYGPDGAKLCEAGSDGGAVAEIADCGLTDGGRYSILAYSFDGLHQDSYTLSLAGWEVYLPLVTRN